ncbi:MAG: acyl-CoA thioesterase, partial [Rhodospirillaceae bacterium]|nr:acyl-CoA thioesterase [Rhodospirillaceae bacterium]
KPVHVGDVVCCYTKILRTGRTSVTIRVQAWTLRRHQADVRIKVTEGNFTFVALDENGNKRLVPDH